MAGKNQQLPRSNGQLRQQMHGKRSSKNCIARQAKCGKWKKKCTDSHASYYKRNKNCTDRVVPNTLLEVKFVQRGGKLYKILVPNSIKHNNPTNASISQPATSTIVFEARNAKGLENTRKSNEPSPFLKPVTLSSAEYKSIPLFKRGERIADTNWLPEETECIIQLMKNHKGFQDDSTTSTETLLPKIVSVNSSEFSSPTDQTASPLASDENEEVEEQRKSVPAFEKSHEESLTIKNFEKITPVCELKVEPLNGESCILSDIKPKVNPSMNKTNVKLGDAQANNSLKTSIEANSENLKPISTLRNGKCFLSLKDNSACSTNLGTIITSPKESSAALTEDSKPPVEVTSEENARDDSSNEKALLLERLKNARTVKIKHQGSNSALVEETKNIQQTDMWKMTAKEFNSETSNSSTLPPSSTKLENGIVKSEPIETSPASQTQKRVMVRLQAESSMSGVSAEVALIDHDYALKVNSQPIERRTVSNYSLRSVLRPKSQPRDKYTYTADKLSKNLTKIYARGRKPSLILQGAAQNQKCTQSAAKSVTMAVNENMLQLQHQKSNDGKSLTFPVTSAIGKQNSVALRSTNAAGNGNLIKGVIKLLMPKSFSNTCSSEDTAQAMNRIAKLSAVANSGGIYPSHLTSTNSNTIQCKYNNSFNKSNAQIITISTCSNENTMCSQSNKASQLASSLATDSPLPDEELNIMEPEVLIFESDDTFIIEDGKLKLCPSRKKPVRKKKNSKNIQKNKVTKYPTNINCKKIPDEDNVQTIETASEEDDSTNDLHKETSNPSLKRTGKYLELIQNTKYQRETLLPPAPKVRKLFICRTEKTASSLLQSCFVWLDKMDEQYLDDGRLDTTEISEDVLFNICDTSHPYTKSQRNHKHYGSKTAYLEENPIVIIEPPSTEAEAEANDSFSTEVIDRKEAENRRADVLRLLEEKRKAIEILRQKNMSHSVAPTVSQTLN